MIYLTPFSPLSENPEISRDSGNISGARSDCNVRGRRPPPPWPGHPARCQLVSPDFPNNRLNPAGFRMSEPWLKPWSLYTIQGNDSSLGVQRGLVFQSRSATKRVIGNASAICGNSARTGLWEPRVSNHPGPPGPVCIARSPCAAWRLIVRRACRPW